ncbi:MAG: response regulator transcription factor [Pseudomonadales bacterium]|nr:response regulator transcription factor [Pseudomonadales bacterium]
MKAVIADDEANLREYLCARLAAVWPELEIVGFAENGREALEMIESEQPDIAFLDIRMPGMSGLEVARQANDRTRIVFVTAYDQYAVEAFERAAVDYLLKPVDDERLGRTVSRLQDGDRGTLMGGAERMSKLLEMLDEGQTQYLNWVRVGERDRTLIVSVGYVAYFKADRKYTTVRTLDREYLIRRTIKDLEAELDPGQFWRIHRSTLVNVAWIEAARRDFRGRYTLTLKGLDDTLRVSDSFRGRFRQM